MFLEICSESLCSNLPSFNCVAYFVISLIELFNLKISFETSPILSFRFCFMSISTFSLLEFILFKVRLIFLIGKYKLTMLKNTKNIITPMISMLEITISKIWYSA